MRGHRRGPSRPSSSPQKGLGRWGGCRRSLPPPRSGWQDPKPAVGAEESGRRRARPRDSPPAGRRSGDGSGGGAGGAGPGGGGSSSSPGWRQRLPAVHGPGGGWPGRGSATRPAAPCGERGAGGVSAGAGGRGGGSAGPGGQAQTTGSPRFSRAGGRAGPGLAPLPRSSLPSPFPSTHSARRSAGGTAASPGPTGTGERRGRTLHLLGAGVRTSAPPFPRRGARAAGGSCRPLRPRSPPPSAACPSWPPVRSPGAGLALQRAPPPAGERGRLRPPPPHTRPVALNGVGPAARLAAPAAPPALGSASRSGPQGKAVPLGRVKQGLPLRRRPEASARTPEAATAGEQRGPPPRLASTTYRSNPPAQLFGLKLGKGGALSQVPSAPPETLIWPR